jgi:hypothetical protein
MANYQVDSRCLGKLTYNRAIYLVQLAWDKDTFQMDHILKGAGDEQN